MLLKVENYTCYCQCRRIPQKDVFHSLCCQFNYTFIKGVYILQGEIDCGAWAFVQSLSNNKKEDMPWDDSKIMWNDVLIKLSDLKKMVCNINDKPFGGRKTCIEQIKKLLRLSDVVKEPREWLQLFDIPMEVANTPLSYYSPYYPCFAALKGVLMGKKIFTGDWVGSMGFSSVAPFYEKIISAMNELETIFILPSSSQNQFRNECTYVKMPFTS